MIIGRKPANTRMPNYQHAKENKLSFGIDSKKYIQYILEKQGGCETLDVRRFINNLIEGKEKKEADTLLLTYKNKLLRSFDKKGKNGIYDVIKELDKEKQAAIANEKVAIDSNKIKNKAFETPNYYSDKVIEIKKWKQA